MTEPHPPAAPGLPGITWPAARRSLRDLEVDLRVARLLPRELCVRHRMLAFGQQGDRVLLLLPPKAEPVLAEEAAFALGREVATFVPADGNLPELITRAFEAADRGETRLTPEGLAAADLGAAGLVYLEDLGSLSESAGSGGGSGLGISLGALDELGGVASAGAPPPAGPAHWQSPAPAAAGPGGERASLPDVVDLGPGPAASEGEPLGEEEELLSDELSAPVLDMDALEAAGPRESTVRLRGVGRVSADGEGARWASRLERAGVSVERLSETGDLLARIQRPDPPALVLLDAGVPGLQGFDVARRIRGTPGGDRPVLVLVPPPLLDGWAVSRDAERVYGVDVLVAHWWPEAVFRASVEAALRRRGRADVALCDSADRSAASELRARAADRYRAGEVEQAMTLYEAALALDPAAASLYVGMARVRLRQRRPDEALALLERAAALDPTSATTLRSLAVLLEKRGFATRAVDAWLRVLAVTAEAGARQEVMAHIQALLGRCGPQEPGRA